MIVVGGALEAEMRGGVHLVELADAPDPREAVDRVSSGIPLGLPSHASPKPAHEVQVIDDVPSPLEGGDAGGEVHHGRHRRHSAQLRRGGIAVLTGQLEGQIASKGVARYDDAIDSVSVQ